MTRSVTILALALALSACSPPRVDNTRLDSADLVVMTDQLAASLADHVPAPSVVTLDRVVNRTHDIMPDGEKWAFMARLRSRLAESPDMKRRGVRFILPAAQRAALNERQQADPLDLSPPTHALTATFYALTAFDRAGRADAYLCDFQLLDLADDRIAWSGRYEVKKAVVRNTYD